MIFTNSYMMNVHVMDKEAEYTHINAIIHPGLSNIYPMDKAAMSSSTILAEVIQL